MNRWLVAFGKAAVITAVLWGLSATSFIEQANQAQLLQQLGLNLRVALIQMGAVVLMFPIINLAFLQPLREAIYDRTKKIEETYGEVEELRDQMNTMRTEYEQRLSAAEAEAREQIQAQIREAQNLRTQLMSEASAKADELLKKATEEIEAEKNRVMGELRGGVVALTLQATEKILGENVDETRNRKLVEDFLKTVEVPS